MLRRVRRVGATLAALLWLAGCSPDVAPPDRGSTPAGSIGVEGPSFARLVARWRTTAATIVYRTEAKVPGQPSSTHQCLRQMVGGAIDRQEGLRMCSRQGRLELTWDPPDRWRMEVVTPLSRFRLVSVAGRTVRCRGARCHEVASETGAAAPFGFLLTRQLGAANAGANVALAPQEIAGIEARCFAATGVGRREWCFSDDGLLLTFLRGSGSDWTSVEAVSIKVP
jgi:hypothetical protein